MSHLAVNQQKIAQKPDAFFIVPGWVRVAFPLAMLMCAVSCLFVDVQVAQYFHAEKMPSFLREMVQNTETFGHGIGVVFILMVASWVNREHLKSYLQIGAITLGAGLCTNVLKFVIGRARPRDLEIASVDVFQTFQGWLPSVNGITASQSFPSGHTTVAFAFAVCLSALHPQGKIAFFFLAAFVAFGRVQCGAHYPSDVFAGAALGWTVAIIAVQKSSFSKLTSSKLKISLASQTTQQQAA